MLKKNNISNDLGLDPIISLTMADMVEVKLQQYLKDNDFKIGDSIPKEVELAEALRVSRNVIREALSRFRMFGLIESRKKRGMVLASPDILGGIERVLHPKLLSESVLKDIFEMRLVFELGMAELLFMRVTPNDIKNLVKIVKNKRKIDTTLFKLENEIEFHGRLYEITGNDTLKRFQVLLLPVFEHVIEYETGRLTKPKVGSATHEDLVKELKNGSIESFRTAMHLHLSPHFEMLEIWDTLNSVNANHHPSKKP